MQKLLQYLSLAGKGFGIVASLTSIPGVPAKDAVLIFFAASVLKDVANRFSEFIEQNYLTPAQAKVIVGFAIALFLVGATQACAPTPAPSPSPAPAPIPTPAPSASTNLTTVGYEIENFLQRFNTGVAVAVPPVDTFLTETHNSGDAQTVALYATLATQFASVVQAGLAAALPPPQIQAAANSQLAPSVVPAVVSNVIATTPAAPAPASSGTTTPTGTSTFYELKPIATDTKGQLVYSF